MKFWSTIEFDPELKILKKGNESKKGLSTTINSFHSRNHLFFTFSYRVAKSESKEWRIKGGLGLSGVVATADSVGAVVVLVVVSFSLSVWVVGVVCRLWVLVSVVGCRSRVFDESKF